MNDNNILNIKNISKNFGNMTNALNDVSFDIKKGEILVILGSSGSGKSTLLNIISSLDKPSSGSVIYKNKDITKFKGKDLINYRKNDIGFVFQSFNLINELTVYENIALICNNKKKIDEVLKLVSLTKVKDSYPKNLSGGEMQRVSIARALVKESDIILCDEPTGSLDYETGKDILKELENLSRNYNKTIVIVTHTFEISKMADRVIKLKNGKIIDEYVNTNVLSIDDIEW